MRKSYYITLGKMYSSFLCERDGGKSTEEETRTRELERMSIIGTITLIRFELSIAQKMGDLIV
jgi:hypothetical protein